MDLSFLPPVNAGLNAVAMTLLITGRRLVKQGRIEAHRRVMLSAFGVSSLFLFFYVSHKVSRNFEATTLHVEGAAKIAYLVMLFTHVVLAATVHVGRMGSRDIVGGTHDDIHASRPRDTEQPHGVTSDANAGGVYK